ncbi:MAG: glycoside hydrolase family 16 protein [Thermoguttaceae bacterium]|nr:glycoside hydrolase family 16 protein [Thermoguttaceae bacterium]MBQ2683008.1 glycoside hydrolase family 16 protein [Thermoguttaceae bacterium]MBR2585343.1 glycoside hydrolase family 16 protein [Thermoguttaceae bacterium]MBR3219983.1 glycoside hydrolase family 16 protein [Thermoguttaceae bacterium]
MKTTPLSPAVRTLFVFCAFLAAFSLPAEEPRQPRFPELEGYPADWLPEPPEGFHWKLDWHDEFDGTEIDTTKWEAVETVRRNAFWSKDAFSLDGSGNLKMTTFLREDGTYIDGCLRTRGKYEKAKGFFVARMRLQRQVGHWSAFWLMGDCEGSIGGGSADGAEIDIMEKPTLDDKVNFAIHWDGYGKEHESVGQFTSIDESIMEGFHTFALWWADDAYRFYVDGRLFWETTAGGICTQPLYVKLSDEIQFDFWAGDIRTAELPDESLVDYVRVYDLVPDEE